MEKRYTGFVCNNVVDNENNLEIVNAIDKLNELDLANKFLNSELDKNKKDLDWYKMWHQRFKRQIEKIQEELETFRPTKLIGNGQCSCHQCTLENGFNSHWTSWCYSFKGHIYCGTCLKKLFPEDYKNAVLEKKY